MKKRYHISLRGGDYNSYVKELTEDEFQLLLDVSFKTETNFEKLYVIELPSIEETQALYDKFIEQNNKFDYYDAIYFLEIESDTLDSMAIEYIAQEMEKIHKKTKKRK